MTAQTPTQNLPVSVDLLLLLTLTPAYIAGNDAFVIVTALFLYLLISLRVPLPTRLENANWATRLGFFLRYALMLTIAVAAVILPAVEHVVNRAVTPVEEDGYSPAYANISDSAIQTESALSYLDAGKNPYVESYADTPLRFYQWLDVGDEAWQDPAYEYFVYLPSSLYLSFPLYKISQIAGILYDQRTIYLTIYFFLLLVLPHLTENPTFKLSLVAVGGLNPLFTNSVMLGMNDVAPFLAFILTLIMIKREKWGWSAILMGIACSLKQYAWFILPFFTLYVWKQNPRQRRWRQTFLSVAMIGFILILSCLPFVLWDWQNFYTDTFAFPAGNAEYLYPIRGFTVGRLLMGAGIIPTFVSPFPFQIMQLAIGIPLLLWMLRYQYKRDLGAMLLASAAFIFGFGTVSRFFHHNYVGVVLALATIGILINFAEQAKQLREMPATQSPNNAPELHPLD